jgi:hypothetical protein
MKPLVMLVTLMVLAEFAATTTATATKDVLTSESLPSAASLSHCPVTCGNANISNMWDEYDWPNIYYPFGFGPDCSLTGFELICNYSTYPPKLCLGDGTTELTNIGFYNNVPIVIVKFNIHIMQSIANSYSGSWDPGQPFIVYGDDTYKSKFVVIGCGVDAYLLDEINTQIGNCSTTCDSDKETRSQIGHCNGIGCCSIPVDRQLSPVLFKINRNKAKSKRALQNAKAFMYTYTNEDYDYYDTFSEYIFSQEDLESSDTVQGRNFFHMLLSWSITSQPNCEKAKDDNTTYACVSKNSECTSNRMAGTGYTCLCSSNYNGNPYILDGCQGDLYFLLSKLS